MAMTYDCFVAGTIGMSAGIVITNSEIAVPAPIDSYSTTKEIERRLAEDFNAPSFVITF